MFPDTASRVAEHTSTAVNERIARDMQERIRTYRQGDRDSLIEQRLRELDAEWDIERTLQTNFAVFSLLGIGLGSRVNERWFALALGVPLFMLQHALQGWCPPLTVLRRLGFRTSREIAEERFALKAVRGDFDAAAESRTAEDTFDAVRH